MPGCASSGGCANSTANGGGGCHLCDVVARLPQKPQLCGQRCTIDGDTCVLVAGHPVWVPCRCKRTQAKAEQATRDGEMKLAGEKKRGNLAFEKRRRVGPHR